MGDDLQRRRPARISGTWGARLAAAAIAVVTAPGVGEEHRVKPGEDWSHLARIVKPGDEIVLLPGTHRPAWFMALRGTEEAPITIRGESAEHPAEIAVQTGARGRAGVSSALLEGPVTAGDSPTAAEAAGSEGAMESGLLLQSPRHLVLQDIVVTGARQNGINIDDQDGSGAIGEPWDAQITLRRVTVRGTGPRGNADGIKLSGLRGVRLEGCVVEGWGGSAIDMVGCHDVVIESCTLRGLEGHEQSSGIQAKGGSADVRITGCVFEDAGMRAVNAGGSTGIAYFRPRVPDDAAPGSWYEAERVTVERCIFVAGDCAVAIVGARGAEVRDCTIVRARRWPFRLLQETTDPRFGPSEGALVSGCLIVAETPRGVVNVGPGTAPETFRWGANAWWADGLRSDDLRLPGEVGGTQVVVDPRLDGSHRPTNAGAAAFGAVR